MSPSRLPDNRQPHYRETDVARLDPTPIGASSLSGSWRRPRRRPSGWLLAHVPPDVLCARVRTGRWAIARPVVANHGL